jgi:hypothetical protein
MNYKLMMSEEIKKKLWEKHDKTTEEHINSAFENRSRTILRDNRPQHQTVPPTLWFVGKANGKPFKIAFILFKEAKAIVIKTAYPANDQTQKKYIELSKPLNKEDD